MLSLTTLAVGYGEHALDCGAGRHAIDQFAHLAAGQRHAEQIALDLVDLGVGNDQVELFFGFDALGRDGQVDVLAELGDVR
jgi:hypothetical protein